MRCRAHDSCRTYHRSHTMSALPPAPDIPYAFLVDQSIAGMYVIQDERFQYVNATWAARHPPQRFTVPADTRESIWQTARSTSGCTACRTPIGT